MTQSAFRNLQRGDIVFAAGNSAAVIEATYFQDYEFKIDIRTQEGEIITGLSENESFMFHQIHAIAEVAV